jgi:hypothetical protein
MTGKKKKKRAASLSAKVKLRYHFRNCTSSLPFEERSGLPLKKNNQVISNAQGALRRKML